VLAPGPPVTIQLLNPGILGGVLEPLVAEFEAGNPDISVEIVDGGNYPSSLEALVTGSIEPDVALLADRAVQSVLDQLEHVPMHEFIERDDFDATLLLENAADMYSTPDGLAAMPFNIAIPMLYANGNLLDQAAVDIESMASLTTSGLLDRCALLVDVAPTCLEIGTSDAFLFTELVTNSGGRIFDTEGFDGSASAVAFDNDIGRGAFEFLTQPVIEGVFQPRSSAELFESGQAVFYMNTSSALGGLDRDFEERGGEVELVPIGIPHLEGQEATGIIPGGGALWILDRDDDRRAVASWLLVEYLVELGALNTYHQASGYVPGRSDASDDASFIEFWSTKPVFRGAYDELVEASTTELPNERDGRAGPFHLIDSAIADRLEQAQTGQLPIDEAFNALVVDANALLAAYSPGTS
jgi:sn-glycerol 3-phosphate transport system substrate-binding protein